MSVFPFLIGAIVGAIVVNFFFDHWDFGDYLFGTLVTAFFGCLIATGAWWVVNNVDLTTKERNNAIAHEMATTERVSVEEPLPSEEVPKPQYDFGGSPDFGGQSFKAGNFGGEK